MIKVKFVKTHPDAKLPTANHNTPLTGDSGYDLFSVSDVDIPAGGSGIVPVGIKVGDLTPGFWFKIEARSGLGFKNGIYPHPGVIDNQYRGDLGVKLYNLTSTPYSIKSGDKIAQIVFYPLIQAEVEWIDEAVETVRGDKGFGSSDQIVLGYKDNSTKV